MLNEYYKSIKIFRRVRCQNKEKKALKKSQITHSYEKEYNLLNLIRRNRNFFEILKCESGELEVNKEDLLKEFKYSTAEQINAINKGLERVDAAITSLGKMEDKTGYIGLIYYSALRHFDSKGLPVDVVREALAGQRQSITNSLSGMNIKEDAILYQLRRENLLTAEKEYIQMQHECMRLFSKKYPHHHASKRYLSKNKDVQISLDDPDKGVAPQKGRER